MNRTFLCLALFVAVAIPILSTPVLGQNSETTQSPQCRHRNSSCSSTSVTPRDMCCPDSECRAPVKEDGLPNGVGNNTRCLAIREATTTQATTTTSEPENCARLYDSCSDFTEQDKCCGNLFCRKPQRGDPGDHDGDNTRCYQTNACRATGETCENSSECCDHEQECRRDLPELQNTCKATTTTTPRPTTTRRSTTRRSTTERTTQRACAERGARCRDSDDCCDRSLVCEGRGRERVCQERRTTTTRPTTSTTERTTEAPRCYEEGEYDCDDNPMGCCDDLKCETETFLFFERSRCQQERTTTTEASTTPRCRNQMESCDVANQCCPELHCAQNVPNGPFLCSRNATESTTENDDDGTTTSRLPILP